MIHVEETFYRPDEALGSEERQLPAECYNLAHTLLSHSETGCLFVPIRSMQYMAVLDAEEFIFVHRESRRMIELAWQAFRPQARDTLEAPVPYSLVWYKPEALVTMQRLQGEFLRALRQLAERQAPVAAGKIISLLPTSG